MFQLLTICFALVLSRALGQSSLTETAKQNGCNTLFDLVSTAGLQQTLDSANGLTLFAPNDAAFAALPAEVTRALVKDKALLQKVLEFHVASGIAPSSILKSDQLLPTLLSNHSLRINFYQDRSVMTVEGNVVSKKDIMASNGIVNIIERVIYPLPNMTIPLYLIFDPDLNNLGFTINKARLVDKLTEQSFTVFAPSNAAMDKIPGQEYNDLWMNQTALTSLLTYHVVPGTVYSAGLSDGQKVTTLQGGQLEVKISTDGVKINGVKVTRSDISTTNGVIHVLDDVLSLPSGSNSTPNHFTSPIIG